VDPRALIAELDQLAEQGIDGEASLWISDRAHVVMPYHMRLDAARERGSGRSKIGTTLRGIGPCYADKAARTGIRMGDLVSPPRFHELLRCNLELKNRELTEIHGEEPIDFDAACEEYDAYARRLAPRVADTAGLLYEEDRRGSVILFEGAQGALLDIDLGTYPYVTSSCTSFLGVGAGTGFSPRRVGAVLGVVKAYTTRVGEGPFPTELTGAVGDELRRTGGEFGATTGRPRRCGWLDTVALRRTALVGDIDALVITKLDVLDGLDEIRAAVAYRIDGREVDDFPASLEGEIEPVYRSMPGWKRSLSGSRTFDELPEEARSYVQFVADACRCPIAMVSVGQERSEVIRLEPWLRPRGAGDGP
ncbi:MAG: adenylosuccinate synthase, partial [Planctomycetes bacterium]|nr:adenylosuccinate synthase [Planctomycetota bacterium]